MMNLMVGGGGGDVDGSIDKASRRPEWLVSQSYSWIKEGECQAVTSGGGLRNSVLRSAALGPLGRRYPVGGEDERHARGEGRERQELGVWDAGEADVLEPGDASNAHWKV